MLMGAATRGPTRRALVVGLPASILVALQPGQSRASEPLVLRLVRTYQDNSCTGGELLCNGTFIAHTLERPWKFINDQRPFDCVKGPPENEIRCVQEGTYRVFLHYKTPDKGHEERGIYWRFELNWFDTKPNCLIQIHIGNTIDDTKGCIVPGNELYNAQQRVEHSGSAIASLEEAFYGTRQPVSTPDKQVQLIISSLPRPTRFIIRDEDGQTTLFQDGLKWMLDNGRGKVFHMFDEDSRTKDHIVFRGAPGTWAKDRFLRYGLHGGIIEQSADKKEWSRFNEGSRVTRDDAVMSFIKSI
jgi:hypothetical protein